MGTVIPIYTAGKYGFDRLTMYCNPRTLTLYQDVNLLTEFQARYEDCHNENREVFIKNDKPSIIKFFLGNACNYRCKYCRQSEHKKKVQRSKSEIENAVDNIKMVADVNKELTIEFWGGEPLLYMDEMIAIASRLPKHIRYHIVSNGSLMDKHIYKWLSKLNLEFILSHDGRGQCMRSGDPLQDKVAYKYLFNLFKNRKNEDDFKINTVITEKNRDLYSLVHMFVDYFDNDIQIAKVEPVIPYNPHAKDVANTYANDNLERELLIGMIRLQEDGLINNIRDIVTTYNDLVDQSNNPHFCIDLHEPKCSMSGRHSLCFDWDSVVYPCQVYGGTDIALGNLSHHPQYPNVKLPLTMWTNDECNCKDCLVVALCRGVCPHLEKKYVASSCFNKKTFYTAIFRLMLYNAGFVVTKIGEPITITDGE